MGKTKLSSPKKILLDDEASRLRGTDDVVQLTPRNIYSLLELPPPPPPSTIASTHPPCIINKMRYKNTQYEHLAAVASQPSAVAYSQSTSAATASIQVSIQQSQVIQGYGQESALGFNYDRQIGRPGPWNTPGMLSSASFGSSRSSSKPLNPESEPYVPTGNTPVLSSGSEFHSHQQQLDIGYGQTNTMSQAYQPHASQLGVTQQQSANRSDHAGMPRGDPGSSHPRFLVQFGDVPTSYQTPSYAAHGVPSSAAYNGRPSGASPYSNFQYGPGNGSMAKPSHGNDTYSLHGGGPVPVSYQAHGYPSTAMGIHGAHNGTTMPPATTHHGQPLEPRASNYPQPFSYRSNTYGPPIEGQKVWYANTGRNNVKYHGNRPRQPIQNQNMTYGSVTGTSSNLGQQGDMHRPVNQDQTRHCDGRREDREWNLANKTQYHSKQAPGSSTYGRQVTSNLATAPVLESASTPRRGAVQFRPGLSSTERTAKDTAKAYTQGPSAGSNPEGGEVIRWGTMPGSQPRAFDTELGPELRQSCQEPGPTPQRSHRNTGSAGSFTNPSYKTTPRDVAAQKSESSPQIQISDGGEMRRRSASPKSLLAAGGIDISTLDTITEHGVLSTNLEGRPFNSTPGSGSIVTPSRRSSHVPSALGVMSPPGTSFNGPLGLPLGIPYPAQPSSAPFNSAAITTVAGQPFNAAAYPPTAMPPLGQPSNNNFGLTSVTQPPQQSCNGPFGPGSFMSTSYNATGPGAGRGMSGALSGLTRGGTCKPTIQEALDPRFLPFAESCRLATVDAFGVVKIKNIPYSVNRAEVMAFLGRNAKIVNETEHEPVHIIMERVTSKTLDCYVEFINFNEAVGAVNRFEINRSGGRGGRLGQRHVEVELSSQDQLMKDMFPKAKNVNWVGGRPEVVPRDPNDIYNSGFQGFVSKEELVMLVKHVEAPQRSPFSQNCLQRPFECLISTLLKYPWYMVNHITVEDRSILHKATIHLLGLLVERVRNGHDSVNLTPMLLKRVWRAALKCPGFTPSMKDDVVFMCGLDGMTAAEHGVPPFAPHWKYLLTIGPKPGAPDDLLLWYIAIIREATEQKGALSLADQAARGGANEQKLFGDLDSHIKYDPDKFHQPLSQVARAEWAGIEKILRQALTPNGQSKLLTF